MASKERSARLYKQLLEAALDQPQPTKALKAAVHLLLVTTEHNARLKPDASDKAFDEAYYGEAYDAEFGGTTIAAPADTGEYDEEFMNLLLRPDC